MEEKYRFQYLFLITAQIEDTDQDGLRQVFIPLFFQNNLENKTTMNTTTISLAFRILLFHHFSFQTAILHLQLNKKRYLHNYSMECKEENLSKINSNNLSIV